MGEAETYAQFAQERYAGSVDRVAEKLRDLATRVERFAKPNPSIHDGHPDVATAAADLVSEVLWTVANLNLAGLLTDAWEAHRTARPHQEPSSPHEVKPPPEPKGTVAAP